MGSREEFESMSHLDALYRTALRMAGGREIPETARRDPRRFHLRSICRVNSSTEVVGSLQVPFEQT